MKKSAAIALRLLVDIYADHALSERPCRYWLQRFKSGDFDVNDIERDGAPKKFQNKELGELLDINRRQTLEESSTALDIDRSTAGKRLYALGLVQKGENWVPHELKEEDIEMLFQRQERKSSFCIGS
ncbi:hypothetical protein Trydic_g11792 [Trypoxylus dichotomus]